MKSRKGINGGYLSTKAAESFQGTFKHLRESFIQVFFFLCCFGRSARQNASLELLSESQSLSATFYL